MGIRVVGTGPSGGAGGWVLLDDFVTSSEVGQVRTRLETLVMLALGFFVLVVPGALIGSRRLALMGLMCSFMFVQSRGLLRRLLLFSPIHLIFGRRPC